MTTIQISDFRLSATGHTGYGKAGEDIVCAAVSTLTQVLAKQVCDAADKGWLTRPPVVIIRHGNVQIRCRPKRMYRAEMAYLWQAIGDGLSMVAHAYPNHVVIKSGKSD